MDAKGGAMRALWVCVLVCSLAMVVDAKCGPGQPCNDMEERAREQGFLGGALGGDTCPTHATTKDQVEVDSVSGPILSTRWIGENDNIVLAQTYPRISTMGSVVWRSKDSGSTGSWQDLSVDFQNALMQAAGKNTSEFSGIVNMDVSPAKPNMVFFQGMGQYNFLSRDFGATVKAFKAPAGLFNFMGSYMLNPVKADYVMALVPREACLYGPDDSSCVKDLYVSFDFGETWGNITRNSQKRIAGFWEANWGVDVEANVTSKVKSDYTEKTILATVYEDLDKVKGLDRWQYNYDKNIHFVRSDDWFGSKHEKVFSCGNLMKKVGPLVYLVAPASCSLKDYKGKTQHGNKRSHELATDDDHAHLYVSENGGRDFKEVCLPVALATHHFAISEGDAGGAIITAVHEIQAHGMDLKTAYAYTTGNEVALSTLSLKTIFCDAYECELLKIDGVPGTFIANVFDWHKLDSPTPTYDDVFSKITFDGGATWGKIPAPTKYADASCRRCVPGTSNCNLHLHVEGLWHTGTNAIPPLYSHANAPGVIMGVGNVGADFDTNPANHCTFLSRDGGHNWEQVLEGPNIYEIGDHGGIIVAARHQSAGVTDEFFFSTDEGRCWQGPVAMDQAMHVSNIRVEDDSASHIFSLQGTECVNNNFTDNSATAKCKGKMMREPQGTLVNVDFMKLLQDFRKCDDSEYEGVSFTPDTCQLGVHYTYQRRKLDSFCFNSKEYKHASPLKKSCDCDKSDYECEFGYQWDAAHGKCKKIQRHSASKDTCWIIEQGKYIPSVTGLREIRSDVCTRKHIIKPKHKGGKDTPYLPWDTDGNGHSVEKTTTKSGMSGVASFFVFLVVMGVMCAAGGFVWTKVLDEPRKNQILGTLTSAYDKAAGLVSGRSMRPTGNFSDMREGFEPLAEADVATAE